MSAAEDYGSRFITSASLVDVKGQPVSEVGIADDLTAKWNFSIPEGVGLHAGDTMTTDIPTVFTLAGNISFDIKDESGEVIGSAVASKDTRKIVITFSQHGADLSNTGKIDGAFSIFLHWDVEQVSRVVGVRIIALSVVKSLLERRVKI